MNKIIKKLLICYFGFFCACTGSTNNGTKIQEKDQAIKWGSKFITEKIVSDTIKFKVSHSKYIEARMFIDSLISQNKKNGFLYFERGYIQAHQPMILDSALKDFNMAEALHYDSQKCEKMKFFCKTIMDRLGGKNN